MEHPVVPTRITIDFRDSIDPHRAWIVGVGDARARVELVAFERSADDTAAASLRSIGHPLVLGDCTCPEFCERDHANE
jgi:hypothetical protein